MTVKYNVNYNKPFMVERYRKDNNIPNSINNDGQNR